MMQLKHLTLPLSAVLFQLLDIPFYLLLLVALVNYHSYILGQLDVLHFKREASTAKNQKRYFVDGFGDIQTAKSIEKMMMENGETFFDDIEIEFEEEDRTGEFSKRAGTFKSPIAEYLHEESKIGHVLIVGPKDSKPKGVVVLMPMTGDEGFSFRRANIAEPLARQGICTIILIVPFYGKRKFEGQCKHYSKTVGNMLLSNAGCYIEGCKLLKWAKKEYDCPVGIAGMSWGGAMASIAATLYPDDVILISYVGSSSPKALVTGLLSLQVAFDKMAEIDGTSIPEAQEKLHQLFSGIDISICNGRQWQLDQNKNLTGFTISATDDHIVRPTEGDLLHNGLKAMFPSLERKFILGGHVLALVPCKYRLVPFIVEAFNQKQ